MLHCRTLVSYRLRLQDCANTTIGSSLARGISGGGGGGREGFGCCGQAFAALCTACVAQLQNQDLTNTLFHPARPCHHLLQSPSASRWDSP